MRYVLTHRAGSVSDRSKNNSYAMQHYRKWVEQIRRHNVDDVATDEHVNLYHPMIQDKLTKGTLKASYAKKLFAFFKRFVMYLKDEKVFDFTPPRIKKYPLIGSS